MTYHRPLSLTGISRRELLRRAAIAGAGLAGVAAVGGCGESNNTAAASSSSSSSSTGAGAAQAPLTGSIEFLNYPQWIGPNEVKDFEQLHPGVKISQNNSAFTGSVSGTAVMVAQNPKQFDMLLADLPVIGQLSAGGFIADMDFSRIPNISLVAPTIRQLYSRGVPTDFGKMGIGYRTDMVKTPPKSWADLWHMAPQYKGKIVAYNLDRDMFGPALKYLGYSVNTRSSAELQKAKQALIELKSSIKAFKAVDIASELVKGTAAIAMTNDYDVALAQTQNSKIGWVVPSEGTSAYLEGWVAVSQSQHLPVVEAFANFHLEPANYASFVDATGTSYVEPGVRPRLTKAIATSNTIGAFGLQGVEFEQYLGQATTQLISNLWEQVQAA
jgi:spermidine/putrescine transport system substrate-binding protein